MATAKTATREFEILMEPDEGGYHVWCPALPGCHSFGETKEEARANIKEAIELWLDDADDSEILESERIVIHLG
jgi:predicted RNase H-like HicB family nuclease